MSRRRADVHRLQELIRLHRLGQGDRAIAKFLSTTSACDRWSGTSRSTSTRSSVSATSPAP